MIEGIVFLIFGLIFFYFSIWLLILLPAEMAEARGRSAVRWVLVSLFFSPGLAIILLWWLGDNPYREDDQNRD